METNQMFVNWWMEKQSVVHPHSVIPLGHRKEESTDTHKWENVQIQKVDRWLSGVGGGGLASAC